MNSQQRIRLYLEKHDVGAMFEVMFRLAKMKYYFLSFVFFWYKTKELMTKLVTEMPCDPVAFLVRLLQQKMASGNAQNVLSVSHLRNGIGDLTSALEIARLRVHSKPLSAPSIKSRSASFKCSQSPHRKAVTVFFPEERFQPRSAPLKPIRYHDRPEVTKRTVRPPKTPTFPLIAKVGSPKANRQVRAICVENFQENVIQVRDFEMVDPLCDETVFLSPLNAAKLEKLVGFSSLPNFNRPQKIDIGPNETWKSRSFARSPESIVEMYEDPCVMAEEGVARVNCGRGLRVSGKLKKDEVDVSVCLRCAKIMKLGNNAEGDCSDNDDKIDSASQVNVAKMPNWTDDSGGSTEGGTANSSPRNAVVHHRKLLATPATQTKSYLTQTDELFSSSFNRLQRRAPSSRSPNLFLREASDEDDELYASKSGERPTPTVRVWEVFSDTDCRS